MTPASIRVRVCGAVIRDDAVLVAAYEDAAGRHYNFPGGGVEPGESLHPAMRREMREEACAEVAVGRLVAVHEYVPSAWGERYDPRPQVGFTFLCAPRDGCEPRPPAAVAPRAEPPQVGVDWLPLDDLDAAPLLPHIPGLAARLRAASHDTTADLFCAEWS